MKKGNFFILLSLVYIFISCSSNKPAVDNSRMSLKNAQQSNEKAIKKLDEVSAQANKAEQEGKIVKSANDEIQTYVSAEKQKIQSQNKQIENSLSELESNKEVDNEAVKRANRLALSNSSSVRIFEEKTKVIIDFLGNETYSKAEIGALFESGEYRLIPSQIKEGEKLFKPVVDKIFLFAEKYKGKFNSLKGEIIITGYSDAMPIEKNSKLYRELASSLNIEEPSITQLNQKLSELRASAVKELLESIIAQRKTAANESLDIKMSVFGRGEEIPNGLAANLAKNDFRRRVVTFYWVVLPKF